jgi:hypothetical protein
MSICLCKRKASFKNSPSKKISKIGAVGSAHGAKRNNEDQDF